jgi:hypothetical protein
LMLQTYQLVILLKTEEAYAVAPIHCISSPHTRQHKPLQQWRGKICNWSFRVIDHFRLDREVVTVGMRLLDRFLAAYSLQQQHSTHTTLSVAPSASPVCSCPSCKRSVDSEFYQLAAMTCIYIAVKLHIDNGTDLDATHRRTFKLQAFCELSRGLFGKEQVIRMEQNILRALHWRVASTPTPMTFVNYYLTTLLPDWKIRRDRHDLVVHVLRELSRYLTELVVCLGDECMDCRPSQIGYVSLLVAMNVLTLEALPASVRKVFCHRVQGVCHLENDLVMRKLQATLSDTLWPEMVVEDCTDADSSHPISLARDYGILSLPQGPKSRALTPPKQGYGDSVQWGCSPVSATNVFSPEVRGRR